MKRKLNAVFRLLEKAEYNLSFYNDLCGNNELLEKPFFLINAFIAKQAHRENKNLYIGMKEINTPSDIALSILYPIMMDTFIDAKSHYIPSENELKYNHVFVKKGISYVFEKHQGKNALKVKVKNGYRWSFYKDFSNSIKDFHIADLDSYSDRKSHKSLDKYYAYCVEQLHMPNVPFFFKKKIIVVCNKTILFNQIQKLGMKHQIPIGTLKAGSLDIVGKNIPIDPLVIVVSDYEQAREYMIKYKEKYEFDYLLVAGDSKTSKVKSLVFNDNANQLFNLFCMIGNQLVSTAKNTKLWHWSKTEELHLMDKHNIDFRIHRIPDCEALVQSTNSLYKYFRELYDNYYLVDIINEAKFILRRILSDKLNGSINNELLLETKKVEMQQIVLAENYDIEDVDHILNPLISRLKEIIEKKKECPIIWDVLPKATRCYDAMVVNNYEFEEWKQASIEHGIDNIKIIKFSDFRKLIKENKAMSSYLMPYFPSTKQIYWLHDQLMDSKIELDLLLYPPEASIFRFFEKRYLNNERINAGQKSTELFPDLDFADHDIEDDHDIISRFEEEHQDTYYEDFNNELSAAEYSGYLIEVLDKNKKTIRMDCPQKLLKRIAEGIVQANVTELEKGDVVLLYNNVGQEVLRNVLMRESDTYKQVYVYSDLWKQRLLGYLSNVSEPNTIDENDYDGLIDASVLQDISLHLGIKAEYIQKNWLPNRSSLLFPQKTKLDRMIKVLQEKGFLSMDEGSEIRYHRKFYTGISISMGLNLSLELQSIMLKNPEDVSDFINQNVIGNKRDYPLLHEFDPSIIRIFLTLNYEEYSFWGLADQDEENDERE